MNSKTPDDRFIAYVIDSMVFFGLDKLSSSIYGLLYLEEDMMNMEQISKKTGYSKASVCNSIKALERAKIIKVISKPKTKTLYFTVDKDFTKHIRLMIELIRKSKIAPAKENFPDIIAQYKNLKTRNKSVKYKQKLVENYYSHILNLEKITNYMESQI